jgi:hypothetical protein
VSIEPGLGTPGVTTSTLRLGPWWVISIDADRCGVEAGAELDGDDPPQPATTTSAPVAVTTASRRRVASRVTRSG